MNKPDSIRSIPHILFHHLTTPFIPSLFILIIYFDKDATLSYIVGVKEILLMTITDEIWSDDNKLRAVFSWLTRIGAAPAFGSRPIGWYQQHQCAAIEYLKSVRKCEGFLLRCKAGIIQSKPTLGAWHDEVSVTQLYNHADNKCRTGSW